MAAYEIWNYLSQAQPELVQEVFAIVHENNRKLYRDALQMLAPAMGLRATKVQELPKRERHAQWAQLLASPQREGLGFNLITQWLIDSQGPMLAAWLNALGIPHDGNGCTDQLPEVSPPLEKLRGAAEVLLKQFPAERVAVYLHTFQELDGVGWPPLAQLLEQETRLSLNTDKAAAVS